MRGKVDSLADGGCGFLLGTAHPHLANPLVQPDADDKQQYRLQVAAHKQSEIVESLQAKPMQQTQRNHPWQVCQ
jgi:hypothetical protein